MTIAPTNLNLLAEQIKNDIDRREDGWVTATLDLCIHLAEARAAFADNISFGQWFDENAIKLGHQDRAAAIAMGQDIDRTRQILGTTKRRSLQLIHAHEFRLTSASKTPKPKSKPISTERERAFAAYDRRKAAGEELTWEAVRAEAKTGHTVVRVVFTAREVEEKIRAEIAQEAPPAPDPAQAEQAAASAEFTRPLEEAVLAYASKLTGAEKKRWDKRVEAFKWQIAQEIADQASAQHRKWKEETGIAYYEKRLDNLEGMLTAWRYSVMRKAEYNTIMRCLHPDTAHSRTSEERAEAFRLFTHYKLKMINDDEERIAARRELYSNMPKTLADMLASKKTRTG